jgi:hypothetical protein
MPVLVESAEPVSSADVEVALLACSDRAKSSALPYVFQTAVAG